MKVVAIVAVVLVGLMFWATADDVGTKECIRCHGEGQVEKPIGSTDVGLGVKMITYGMFPCDWCKGKGLVPEDFVPFDVPEEDQSGE